MLAGVRGHPGLTSDELAEAVGMQRHQPARRLPELERMGLVRKGEARPSRLSGRRGVTWFVVEGEGGG